jgi:hypothetical protein
MPKEIKMILLILSSMFVAALSTGMTALLSLLMSMLLGGPGITPIFVILCVLYALVGGWGIRQLINYVDPTQEYGEMWTCYAWGLSVITMGIAGFYVHSLLTTPFRYG